MNKRFYSILSTTLIISLLSPLALASSAISIKPKDYSYHDQNMALGSSIDVPYLITNNTSSTLYNVKARHLSRGMSSSVCQTLAPNSSCILNINIQKRLTLKPGVINQRFKVCSSRYSSQCTWVPAEFRLNLTVTNDNTFLAITDIHLSAGKISDIGYGQDTNDPLWDSTLRKMGRLNYEQLPQFILLLGDLPAHGDRPNSEKNIGTVLRGFSSLPAIKDTQLPVFFVFGNNDSLVRNYGPFSNGSTNLFSLDPEHNSPENKGWPALNANTDCVKSPRRACTYTTSSPMPVDHAEDMAYAQTRGYYSAYPLGTAYRLRFISLNSIIFSHEYFQTGEAQLKDAQEQMDWLASQLQSAQKNGEAVYIAMHIPVGTDAFNHGDDMWNDTLLLKNGLRFRDNFLALMSQYKEQVRTVVTGHTHLNELRALYADQALTSLSILGVGVPGITPNHYNNPGMQVYSYNRSYQLTEAKTYFNTPNLSQWDNYSFQNDYACAKNTTMLQCVSTNLLPYIPEWKQNPQQLASNPYELDFSVKAPNFDPSKGGYSSWEIILNTIQVVPIEE
jgi:predicted phosphodiesterase